MAKVSRQAKESFGKSDAHMKALVGCLKEIAYTKLLVNVIADFLDLAMLCYANAFFKYQEIEDRYLAIIAKYNKDEITLFSKAMAELVLYAEEHPNEDLFIEMYSTIGGSSSELGQFFTPVSVATAMVHLVGDEAMLEAYKSKGYIDMLEPTCGSGVSCMALVRHVKELGLNPQHDLFITGYDIDSRCVAMCFLNLAINNIPAVIYHANTLSLTIWQTYYTPAYYLSGMCWRAKK